MNNKNKTWLKVKPETEDLSNFGNNDASTYKYLIYSTDKILLIISLPKYVCH